MTRRSAAPHARTLVAAVALVMVAGSAPAPAEVLEPVARPAPAPAGGGAGGQMVPLPHVMADRLGVTWDVQPDGSIGDGGNDLYDGASRLTVGGQMFAPQPQVAFDPQANELTFAAQELGGLRVSRRVAVNAAGGWCRYVEVLENPTAQPVRASLRLNFDMGQGVQQAQPVEDEKKRTPVGVAVFDGRRAVAMLGGSAGGKVPTRYTTQPNSDQCDLTVEVDVPAGRTAAVAHFQAMRPTMADAVAFLAGAKAKDLLGGLPKDVRRAIVNFRPAGESLVGDVELPRHAVLDTVELRSGDVYRGTLADAVFKLDTFHGPVELPADRVIGMVTIGSYRPAQLFVTTDGEVVGGRLGGGTLGIRLSGGQVLSLPLAAVTKVGCRKRAGEPAEPAEVRTDKPMALFRDGQRLAVDPPAAAVAVATLYGDMRLAPDSLAAIVFHAEEQAVHQVRLRDGSRFAGVVAGDGLDLRLRGGWAASGPSAATGPAAAAASPPVINVPLASLTRLQVAPAADDETDPAADADAPALALNNGDVLVGSAAGTLELDTGFDVIRMNGPEVRSIRPVEPPDGGRPLPAELTVGLWDGATVSGRLNGDAVDFMLGSGATVRVPAALIGRYEHPHPAAPPAAVRRVRDIVAQLNDPDWKKRERAADQLRSLGQAAAGVLKEVREGQPPEAQKQIDTILKAVDVEKPVGGR